MGEHFRKRLDRLWLLLLVVSLAAILVMFWKGNQCAYLGTDFRGYYASAQIAVTHGFSRVYDQKLQIAAQEALPMQCPGGVPQPPLLHVSMPYLAVFVLLFLPFTAFEFTTSYLLYSALGLAVLAAYLVRFTKALGMRSSPLRLLEWMICLPLLSNLSLGQVNILLVICLGEFILASVQGKQVRSGWWLAGMLMKPHILILLLPGLAVSRRWKVLFSFGAGTALVLGGSLLLAGVEGVTAAVDLAIRFAGPLIQTSAAMMNWRALALNLEALIPGWMAWLAAGTGMVVIGSVTISRWLRQNQKAEKDFLLLMLATLSATFTISWHAHFYMLILVIPILLFLDQKGAIPSSMLAAWAFGPPGLYLAVYLVQPDLARNMLGLGYLGMNLILWAWAIRHPNFVHERGAL